MALGTVNVGRPLDPTKYVEAALLASPNGVATLDAEGKVPVNQLPAGSTQEGIQQSINEATKEFVTGSEMTDAITRATENFVTDTVMNEAITEATKNHVTGDEVQQSINEATQGFATASEIEEAVSEAKKPGTDAQAAIDSHTNNKANPHGVDAEQVGADPKGTAASAVSSHNTDVSAHGDIRLLITGLTNRLNALADSDDETLDQMSEIVAYIKENKDLIDSITTSKVSVVDIVNDLVTNVTNKPLSAAQGVALKKLIDDMAVDSTLSTEGKPADAKATGIAISEAKNSAAAAQQAANEAKETAEQLVTDAEAEFRRYYGIVNKTTTINKDSSDNTTSIVETGDGVTATTTFEETETGKIITTSVIPEDGEYNYTKTVVIETITTGTRITESYTKEAK